MPVRFPAMRTQAPEQCGHVMRDGNSVSVLRAFYNQACG